jgi:hypothetical protein
LTISRGIAIFLLFILPFAVVSLPGIPTAAGRLVAVSSLLFAGPVIFLWYGVNPKSKIIGERAKLSEKARPHVERIARVLIVAFAVFFVYVLTVPFATDLFYYAKGKEKPITIVGVIKDKSVPLFGLWFLKQGVRLSYGAKSYALLYSWTPIRFDRSYEFVILPRSRMILDFRERD